MQTKCQVRLPRIKEIYEAEFAALKTFAARRVRDECTAEHIVAEAFGALVREMEEKPHHYLFTGTAEAFLIAEVHDSCNFWLSLAGKKGALPYIGDSEVQRQIILELSSYHLYDSLYPYLRWLPKRWRSKVGFRIILTSIYFFGPPPSIRRAVQSIQL